MASPTFTLRASEPLGSNLTARGDSLGGVALRDLNRYYESVETATREIALSEPEWNFLRDILNGTVLDESTARYLWAEVEDAEPAYGEKWGVNPTDLAGRIRTMPVFSRLAICDSVERWWRSQRGA